MGEIAKHLMGLRGGGKLTKLSSPLRVDASIEVGSKMMPSMSKYDKEEHARLKKEIAATKKALEDWVPEDVAARARKSLETNLRVKLARMEEVKARLSDGEDED